ncbi:hypothetical protein C0J52_02425, partial [Blattella germanica]
PQIQYNVEQFKISLLEKDYVRLLDDIQAAIEDSDDGCKDPDFETEDYTSSDSEVEGIRKKTKKPKIMLDLNNKHSYVNDEYNKLESENHEVENDLTVTQGEVNEVDVSLTNEAIRPIIMIFSSSCVIRQICMQIKRDRDVMILSWMDKRVISMVSTAHSATMVQPEVEYNRYMHGVDNADQYLSLYPFKRKTVKWPKKLFFHILLCTLFQQP